MFLNVFLFQAELFGSVEDEHFHADIRGDVARGEFGNDDHEDNRQRHGPNGWLFADDSDHGMVGPERFQALPWIGTFVFDAGLQDEVADAGERDSDKGQQAASEHASGGAFHGHARPPGAQEEKGEIAGGGNGKGLADHEVDVELLDLHAKQDRDSANDYRSDFE